MDEQEQAPSSRMRSFEWGTCSGAPWIHDGVRDVARRLARCETIKRLEKAGKSALIDSRHKGIPLHAHRALDSLHDPLYGPVEAVRAMTAKGALKVYCPHMVSDILTPMSLPLPGTCKAGITSLRYRLYAAGLVNMRTVCLAPLAGVLMTDFLVRADLTGRRAGKPMGIGERRARLVRAHLTAAVVSGILAVAVSPGALTAAVVAYASTAAWSGLMAGIYYAIAHKSEIAYALRTRAGKVLDSVKAAVDKATADEGATEAASAIPVPRVRLGLAAAMLSLALTHGKL